MELESLEMKGKREKKKKKRIEYNTVNDFKMKRYASNIITVHAADRVYCLIAS